MNELVAGVDSSTQSTKVVVCEAASGRVVRTGQAAHPDATEVDPAEWWAALRTAGDGLLDDVAAIAVAGQQHGMVTVDDDGDVVRDALLWNDVRSAGAADDLVAELGGGQPWADAVGSVPLASFTVTKLRWLAEHEPDAAKRVARVLLPHDWLTWQLLDRAGDPTTDRGDASGTGYYSAVDGSYRTDLLVRAFGREPGLPTVLEPAGAAGHTADGVLVAAGTGDNMAAGLALELADGDVAVSLGTSGTVFGVSEKPVADGSGVVAGFADATGRYLPLACTLNAARVLTSTAAMLGTDLEGLDQLALSASPGADGLTLLPYLDGERTPNLPDATGSLVGLRRSNMTPANVARAAVEGMLCGLAAGLDSLREHGVALRRVLLTGGASRSAAVRAIAPGVFGADVVLPPEMEHVAVGAARQAAWALRGGAEPPSWRGHDDGTTLTPPAADLDAGANVVEAHRAARQHLHP
ncbi:xylulokinase [Prauserella alba]|uniref:Xylulose kinase n=1 Tax=Prauserella alba TaxID=176898 RepID=A0ABP4GEE5_9PSEU|nr:xylulokinase [Prauserella alba]MCP2183767.1 xylulokinase [Prauserella alba]